MTAKLTLSRNFSKMAAKYDGHSAVQRECAGILSGLLADTCAKSVLEIGCGTGNYTGILAEKYVKSRITAVDISKDMLKIASEKLSGSKNIDLIEADGECFGPGGHFDLITSNASFQWFSDIRSAFERYYGMLFPGGRLVFSIYGPGTFRELSSVIEEYFGKGHRLTSQDFLGERELAKMFTGWAGGVEFLERDLIIKFDSLMGLLKDIKLSGTRGFGIGRRLGKKDIERIEKIYVDRYGGISATHNVYFFAIGKGP